MAVLVDADIGVVEDGMAVACTAVILRRVSDGWRISELGESLGWRIAGVGESLREPGWPPRKGQTFEVYPKQTQ